MLEHLRGPDGVPLRTVLIASLIILTSVAVALTGYLSFTNSRSAVNQVVAQLHSEIAVGIQDRIDELLFMPELINRLNGDAIEQGVLDVDDATAMERHFWHQIRELDSVSSIYFGNSRGGLANAGREGSGGFLYTISTDGFSAGPFRKYATDDAGNRRELVATVPEFDARDRPWYVRARDTGKPGWSDIYVLFTGQDMAIAASRPVYGPQGELLGVLASDLFLSQLGSYLAELTIGKTGEAFVIERSGMLVATSTDEPLFAPGETGQWRRLAVGESENPLIRATFDHVSAMPGDLGGTGQRQAFDITIDGRRYFVELSSLQGFPGLEWFTLVMVPESDFMAPIHANTRWTLMLIIAALLLAIGGGILASRWVTAPLLRLNAAARALTGEGVPSTVKPGRIRELNELSASFNAMAVRLNESLASLRAQVAERENAEELLRRSESRYRTVVESINEVVFQTDAEGCWTFLNPAWEELTGHTIESSIGHRFLDYLYGVDQEQQRQQFSRLATNQGMIYRGEVRFVHEDGTLRWVQVYARRSSDEEGNFTGTSGTLSDVSERNRVETALRRAQKMDAIGRLSGGIAHDFNNLLAIIVGNLGLLERRGELDEGSRKWLVSIGKAAQRGEQLTRQLLGFSRREGDDTQVIDLNRLIVDLKELIARSITPGITLEVELAEEPWNTAIDPGDFEDSLINLVINARDAMPSGGILRIATRNRNLDADSCPSNPSLIPGDYVELAVTDNGSGIAPEHLERIFEPFFSTKPRSKGTGLGLAMVYGFVQRSGGCIGVDSVPDEGTRITIQLPRARSPAESGIAEPASDESPPTGEETILVVDDEDELLELVRTLLEDLGYRVICAGNGSEALARLNENPEISVLFSDVIMPGGLDGYQLAAAAIQSRPDLKVLLTSGFPGHDNYTNDHQRLTASLLHKPYTPLELALRIRALIDQHPPDSNGVGAPR